MTNSRVRFLPVAVAGLAWALLCLVLHARGHAPSAVLLPIPRESYYLWQALFVVPLLLLSWLGLSGAAHLVAGGASVRDTAAATGPAVGLTLLGYVAVDAAVYAAGGFDALTAAARILGPAVALVLWVSVAASLRRNGRVGWGRALGASLAGLVAQAVIAGPFLR